MSRTRFRAAHLPIAPGVVGPPPQPRLGLWTHTPSQTSRLASQVSGFSHAFRIAVAAPGYARARPDRTILGRAGIRLPISS
jgi:hypothetical protein